VTAPDVRLTARNGAWFIRVDHMTDCAGVLSDAKQVAEEMVRDSWPGPVRWRHPEAGVWTLEAVPVVVDRRVRRMRTGLSQVPGQVFRHIDQGPDAMRWSSDDPGGVS
jgi:hypothetical protein